MENIINDNLKNKYPNAKVKSIENISNKYSIQYYTNNTEQNSENMFNSQLEYIQNDIKNYIREMIKLYFNKEIVIEDDIIFIL
jgi:hypothetical protein